MKKFLLFAASLLCFAGCGNHNGNKETQETAVDLNAGPVVIMNTSKGTMKIRLFDATPRHRDNFVKLVREGFYNGVKFHRVIEGFMIQGGDPLSKTDTVVANWGTGGPGYTVEAEFNPEIRHCKGALAAARLGDMANPLRASSGSQFYIVQSEEGCRHLDGQYTVYGQVIDGMEVVDLIAAVATDPYDHPLEPVVILNAVMDEPEAAEESDAAGEAELASEPEAEPEAAAKPETSAKPETAPASKPVAPMEKFSPVSER